MRPNDSLEQSAALRHLAIDGSTFVDDEYIVKGVAGRLLWKLARRLILLKRRLDEREAPLRIESTGRGRFRLLVSAAIHLESVN